MEAAEEEAIDGVGAVAVVAAAAAVAVAGAGKKIGAIQRARRRPHPQEAAFSFAGRLPKWMTRTILSSI